jgi:hypothetical protein
MAHRSMIWKPASGFVMLAREIYPNALKYGSSGARLNEWY